MTKKEAIKRLKEIDIRDALQEDYDALYIAIKALEQDCVGATQKCVVNALDMPCEDCISRAELLKAIDTWDKFGLDDTNHLFRLDNLSLPHYVPYIHYDDVIKCIKGMPSVQPKTDIDKIGSIVKEWQDDSWTDNLSNECMIKILNYFKSEE